MSTEEPPSGSSSLLRTTGRLVQAARRHMVAILVVGSVVSVACGAAAVLRTRAADAEPSPTPSPVASPTPSPVSTPALSDYVPPAAPSAGPEVLLEATDGWVLTQLSTDDESLETNWNLLYLTSPAGDPHTVNLPVGLAFTDLVDWLPGTTLVILQNYEQYAEDYSLTQSVVDLTTGQSLSSYTVDKEQYVHLQFVEDGTTDVLAAMGPRGFGDAEREAHVVVRLRADGQELARSAPFVLERGLLEGVEGTIDEGWVLVSPGGAWVLTDGLGDSRLLDAATLLPTPLIVSAETDECSNHGWLTSTQLAYSCVYRDADGQYERSDVSLATVGGEDPTVLLDSAALERRGTVLSVTQVGSVTVVGFDTHFGSDAGRTAGLYRLGNDMELVRVPGQSPNRDDGLWVNAGGVADDRMIVTAYDGTRFRSLVSVDPTTGATQTLIPAAAVDGVRFQNLVAGS